jgi:hypothetical protein
MFLQVRLDIESANVQRKVWRRNPSQALQAFMLPCMTFWNSAATFLATASLSYATNDKSLNEKQKEIINKHFYADDLLTGGNNIDEFDENILAVFSTLNKYHLKVRKFKTNIKAAIIDISQGIM